MKIVHNIIITVYHTQEVNNLKYKENRSWAEWKSLVYKVTFLPKVGFLCINLKKIHSLEQEVSEYLA